MGVMLYAMVLGHYPFENKEDKEALRQMIINKEIKIPRKGQVNKMMRRKSKLDTKDSQGAAPTEAKNDQVLQIPENISDECREVIELMLHKDPDKRISLFDLQHHPWLCRYSQSNKQMWEETSNERSRSNSNSFDGSSDSGSLKSAKESKGSRKEVFEQDQK